MWKLVLSCEQAIVVTWQLMNISTGYKTMTVGRDCSDGTATRYGLDGARFESWWGDEIFPTRPDQLWGPISLLPVQWVPSLFPGGKAVGAWRWPQSRD